MLEALEVLARTMAFGAILWCLGHAFAPSTRFLRSERILIGLIFSFYLIHFQSILLRIGLPLNSWIPIGICLGIGLLSAYRRRSPKERLTASLSLRRILPFLSFCVIAILVLSADWPRTTPMSSDPDQHTWFAHQILRFDAIPFSQMPVGAEPFHYPAGTGVFGAIASRYMGIDWTPNATAVLPSLLMLWLMLFVWEIFSTRPRLTRVFICGSVFALGWGVEFPGMHHEGLGRLFQLPLFVYLACVAFHPNLRPLSERLFIVVLVSGLVLSLNPMTAPILFVLFLASCVSLAWGLTQNYLLYLGAVGAGLLALVVIFLGDPFFGGIAGWAPPHFDSNLGGSETLAPSLEWARAYKSIPQTLSFEFYKGLLSPFSSHAVKTMITVLVAFALACWSLGRRRATLVAVSFVAMVSVATALSNLAGSSWASGLMIQYTARETSALLSFAVFMLSAAFGGWAFEKAHSMFRHGQWLGFALCGVLGSLLVGHVGLRFFSKVDVYHKRRNALRVENEALQEDQSFQRLREKAREVWRLTPSSRIALENRNFSRIKLQLWIFPRGALNLLAFEKNSNPAFFYFQASKHYKRSDYDELICKRLNRERLREMGILHIALTPLDEGGGKYPDCPGLAPYKKRGEYVLLSLEDQ